MIVFGGYGGFGQRRAFYNDVHVLSSRDDGQMEWAKAEPGGTPPRPRGDHTASLVALPHSPQSKFLLVMGGRDHSSFFKDMHVLDVGLMTWSSIPNNPAPTAPQTMCNHVALGIQSVPNYKLFVFGGQAGGAARTDWKYINSIDCMDLGRMEWMAADSSGASFVQGAFPAPREDCAFAYDRKNNRVLVHGGWADRWFRELYYLDVASIVGPPYACYSLEPAEGPMTGQTPIALRGEDFSAASSIKIQFSDGKNTEVVDGKFVSTTQLTCNSPDWTKYSPGEVSPASRLRACTRARIHTYTFICSHARPQTHAHIRTHARTHTFTRTHARTQSHARTHARTHASTHASTHARTHARTHAPHYTNLTTPHTHTTMHTPLHSTPLHSTPHR